MASYQDSSEVSTQTQSSAEAPSRSFRARLFCEDDIPRARILIEQHHALTTFRDQILCETKLQRHFELILSRPLTAIGITADLHGDAVGLAWANVSSYMLTEGPPIVSVNLIAVDGGLPAIRRAKVFLLLVSAVRHWAVSKGAQETYVHVTTGFKPRATDKLLHAAGAKFLGGSYVLS